MRLDKCFFCSSTVYPGHGICFVRNDSKVFRFCRSKCHKNFKMKRNPRKVRWTKAYRALHGKDMTGDTTFEFERRRNRPERYDRELVGATLKAMKRVTELRETRAARFWEERMKGKAASNLAADRKQLADEIHLIRAPASLRAGTAEAAAAAEAEAAEAEEERAAEEAAAFAEPMEEEEEQLVAEPVVAKAKTRLPKLRAVAAARTRTRGT